MQSPTHDCPPRREHPRLTTHTLSSVSFSENSCALAIASSLALSLSTHSTNTISPAPPVLGCTGRSAIAARKYLLFVESTMPMFSMNASAFDAPLGVFGHCLNSPGFASTLLGSTAVRLGHLKRALSNATIK